MLRWIYGASFEDSLGLTWNCWIAAGYTPAIKTEEITNRPTPAAGRTQERRIMFAKKRSAQIMEIPAKIALAGRSAFTSV